ncbi:unnamed protein product [Owenia fusiformis]|uniref:Uncharacterized protein n=1 Tax=Owenia fusiformis TaxID=6347 RepID=A0A8S4NPD5_OWEFU|nr:unnamed protein product [Owenia fusiformis]
MSKSDSEIEINAASDVEKDAKAESKAETTNPLDRAKISKVEAVSMIFIFILIDVGKQTSSYAVKYYNNGKYPIPQTMIVAVTEYLKLSLVFGKLVYDGVLSDVKLSLKFAIPSIIYAVNNNIYYFAFYYTTPAVWNILTQFRIILTAVVYRVIFKREVTRLQWGALMLLIFGIVLTQRTSSDHGDEGGNLLKPQALILALVVCGLSVVGSVYMEYLFKNDKRTFFEQQLQLYIFGSMAASIFYFGEIKSTPSWEQWQEVPVTAIGWLILCIFLSGIIGISVALIVKKLDNIVKIYTQALSNMATTIISAILFPDHLKLNVTFAVALVAVFTAIHLYERKHIRC